MGRKIVFLLVIIIMFIMISGCGKKARVHDVLNNGVYCENAQWDVTIDKVTNGLNTTTNAHISFGKGAYKIDVKNIEGRIVQEMLIKGSDLFLFNRNINTVFKHDFSKEHTKVFIQNVFINAGIYKQKESILEEVKLQGKKHDVVKYEVLKKIDDIYIKTNVKEWRNKKTGFVSKIHTETLESRFPLGDKIRTIKPVIEGYMVKNFKCSRKFEQEKFDIPQNFKVVDIQGEYNSAMKKRGLSKAVTKQKIEVK